MLVNLLLLVHLKAAILGIGYADPDAFDSENIDEQGIAYVCDPGGYSTELDALCRVFGY